MKQLQEHFKAFPSLSKSGVCREAGISLSTLKFILLGRLPLSEKTKEKLFPVLNRYGGNLS